MKFELFNFGGHGRGVVAALAMTMLLGASQAANAEPQPSLAGAWTLVAADTERPDGTRTHAYGDNPKGRMMIDTQGRYSIQIFRSDRPRFASGDRNKGTPEEYKAQVLGISSHYGEITVDWANHTLRMTAEEASNLNLRGKPETRPFQFDGKVLSYRIPPGPDGNTPISVWRREPEARAPR